MTYNLCMRLICLCVKKFHICNKLILGQKYPTINVLLLLLVAVMDPNNNKNLL